MSKNLIIRISNGLGNQLFMYASAYAMSKELSRILLIDNESSFNSTKNISDYLLNNFNILQFFTIIYTPKRKWLLAATSMYYVFKLINLIIYIFGMT